MSSDQFELEYGRIFDGDEKWQSMPAPTGTLFDWDDTSTYVREPPYFRRLSPDIRRRPRTSRGQESSPCWATRSPPITFPPLVASPSILRPDKYLLEHSVPLAEFNSFGSRRGNHEVMMRGTFGNIRLRNLMVPGMEGSWTAPCSERRDDEHLRRRDAISARGDAPGRDRRQGIRLGKFARLGSKGLALLGIKAVIAQIATSASTAATSFAWACSRCNSRTGVRRNRWV